MRRFLPFYRLPTQDIRSPQNVSIQLCLVTAEQSIFNVLVSENFDFMTLFEVATPN